jgi:hypothetical protein
VIKDKTFSSGIEQGVKQEQERIVEIIKDYICFDYKVIKVNCGHTACRRNANIIKAIKKRQDYGV